MQGRYGVQLEEGQVYQGTIAPLGGDGPRRRWLVVAPFGKMHLHSIDDPTDLHCMPLTTALQGIADGRLKLVGRDLDHPALQLQRTKEQVNIRDTHLSLYGKALNDMLALLEYAVREEQPYAPYAAGEILALINDAIYTAPQVEAVRQHVHEILGAPPAGPALTSTETEPSPLHAG